MIRVFLTFSLITLFCLVAATSHADEFVTSYQGKNLGVCEPVQPPRQLRIMKPLPRENPCEGKGSSIVARTAVNEHLLFLCENNQIVDNFDIAIGSGGVGKTTAGDFKTPLGTYRLGAPRLSDRFQIFIPIGYPTREQKEQGFSGGDVGLHGPARPFRCVGFLNVTFDWTTGCLAVADDGFIARIAAWLDSHPKAHVIHIE